MSLFRNNSPFLINSTLWLGALIFLVFGVYNFTFALQNNTKESLKFELEGVYLSKYFSTVHFNVAGNDFGGGFFWLPVKKLENPIKITAGGGSIICSNQLRGFYYNSQRGERLRPLDEETLKALKNYSDTYNNLTIDGGFYTSCVKAESTSKDDPYGIYGHIVHQYNQKSFDLIAGVPYNVKTNKMVSNGLKCNFQRLNNTYPFGYLYDSAGHIGMVGAKFKDDISDEERARFHGNLNKLLKDQCINEIFNQEENEKDISYIGANFQIEGCNPLSTCLIGGNGTAKTTLFNLGIRGIVGFTNEVNQSAKKEFEGNVFDSTLLLKTDSTISNMINIANKNVEKFCRGKWTSSSIPGVNKADSNLLCIKGVDLIGKSEQLAGKTIVIKNGNLRLKGFLPVNSRPLNVFIDRGNLILDASSIDTGALTAFDSFGYLNGYQSCNDCSKAHFLKGNFLINGLLLASTGNNELTSLKNRLYIHGKVISFNTFKEPTETRKNTIKNILNSQIDYEKYISFDKLFSWRCDPVRGLGGDGTRCKGQDSENSMLVDKSFALIDMNIPSPFFK